MQEIRIAGADFDARFFSRGKYAFSVAVAPDFGVSLGRIACGDFGEMSALPKKLRRHDSGDGLSAVVESESQIPFGCEYEVKRSVELSDGFARVTTDIAALNHGSISVLELEPVVFAAPWHELEFLLRGEKKFRSVKPAPERRLLYSGVEPVVLLRLRAADGTAAEFLLGDDLWRHCAARRLGGDARFELVAEGDTVTLERLPLIFDTALHPELKVPKRPWRFSATLAWRRGAPAAPAAAAAEEISLDGCALAAANRRLVRSRIRSGEGGLRLIAAPGFCSDAAHLERPGQGELEHCDLDELVSLRLWGCRRRRGGSFTIATAPTSPFAGSTAAANLASAPRPLISDGEEQP